MLSLNAPLRGIQAALAIITVALNGYVTKWYLDHTLTTVAPVCTIYLLSLGAATLVALPYLALNPSLSKGGSTAGAQETGRYFNKYAVLALDFVLMALWFAGFVSLAVFQHKLILCGGRVCQIMAGGSAVGAITWAAFAVTATMAGLHIMRTRTGAEVSGPASKSTAEMTTSTAETKEPEPHTASWVGDEKSSA